MSRVSSSAPGTPAPDGAGPDQAGPDQAGPDQAEPDLAGSDRLTASCTAVLDGWPAPTPEQEQLRWDYLRHLADRPPGPPHGWSRGCPDAHLTASSLVCAPDGQVLLTLHARIGRWLQTGGHLEPEDASLPAAAHREATEESGIDALELVPGPLLLSRHAVRCGAAVLDHLDVQFLVRAPAAVPPVVGAESLDVRWFPADGLPDVDSSVSDLVAAASRRLGWA